MNPIHPRLVVLMEDPLVHTDEQPTCLDPHYPCQQDAKEPRLGPQAVSRPREQYASRCTRERREPVP